MKLLSLLLLFLSSNFDKVKTTVNYQYQIYEEVRYIKGIFNPDIKIQTLVEEIPITIHEDTIDLNNYYPLDSLIISGNFKYLYFYQDNTLCASLFNKNKLEYTIQDFKLLNGNWYTINIPYQITESKTKRLSSINKILINNNLYTNIS